MASSSSDSFGSFLRRAPWVVRAAVVVCWGIGALAVVSSSLVIARIFSVRNELQLKKEHETQARAKRREHQGAAFQYAFEVKDLSVPLSGRKTLKSAYAQFGILFDCPTEASKKALEMSRAFVLDAIFEAAGDFRVEDFREPEGFGKFKQAILSRLRARFHDETPRSLSIQSWLLN